MLTVAFTMGMLQTLGSPGFISIVNDLVPARAISSAVALTFLGFNFGRIVGGIAAGILLVALSPDLVTAAALTISSRVSSRRCPRSRRADQGHGGRGPDNVASRWSGRSSRPRAYAVRYPTLGHDPAAGDRAGRDRPLVHVHAAGRDPRHRAPAGCSRPPVRRRRRRWTVRRSRRGAADAARRARPSRVRRPDPCGDAA